MKIYKTKIKGVLKIKTLKFMDKRGFFSEIYNYNSFKRLIPSSFIQDNVSFNKRKFTFRGLHFQLSPFEQGKLVRVESGEIVDFVIDLRKFSKTYLKMIKVKLSENNFMQLYIPKGCAHGFLTLTPNTKVIYKVDNYYSKIHESGYNILDKKIILKGFNKKNFIISKKDKKLPLLYEKN
jgi:dTDP-4-dehydrorhamnose 3,5-epimerase